MRTPADVPRSERAGPPRGRAWLVAAAAAVFAVLTSIRGIAGFYTDYLWFDTLGLTTVWSSVLGAKLALGAIFTGLFFVLCWTNLLIADRLAPRFRLAGPEEDVVERYRELIGHRTSLVRVAAALALALIAGVPVAAQWNAWLLFTNATRFGRSDPLFGTDIGFYVFQLPFLAFVVDWAFAALLIVLVVTAVAHYLNGGIRVQAPVQRVSPQVKAHLSVLLAVLALLRAAGYYLQRFELTTSDGSVVRGAGFTDVSAQLPALNLLILISLAAAVGLIVNIWRRGWVLPVLALGLWAFVAVVVGGAYPAFIQRFRVEPAESTREATYIQHNIDATRFALGMSDVEVNDFDYNENLDAGDLQENASTIRNVRLLDPGIVDDTYQRLQGGRTFYRFPDLDVDRYEIDGELTQVVLASRELARENIPQSSWEARHLAYTHGFGAVVAPANAVTATGRPRFVLGGLPPSGLPELALQQPSIYFGEDIGGYSIVDTARPEIDFREGETASYDGEGGVGIGGYVRRLAFALRFGDLNPIISNFIEDDSRILYIRDVRERVQTVAPFLHFDRDLYPVIVDGRIVYVLDGYTTSDHFPYGQTADVGGLDPGSGLDHRFNYVRNSVKAMVDAYDGDVTLYVMDPTDPVLQAYRAAFPRLFTDLEQMPQALQSHLRYPEDLFRVQTTMWGRYHLEDPIDFYEQRDAWRVSQDPGAEAGVSATTATTDATGQLGPAQRRRIDPYYLLMRLPEEDYDSFVMLRPFVPFSEDDNRPELAAFMTAKSDIDEYGRLQTFVTPRGDPPDGPAIVASNINSNEQIAQTISLLDQRGSEVRLGNLLLIPVEESILYVRPLYVQAAGSSPIPELRNVIVAYGGRVVMRNTLQEALTQLFGEAPATHEAPVAGERPPVPDGAVEPAPGEPAPQPPAQPPPTSVAELLAAADQAFAAAEEALRAGDLAGYQARVREAQELVRQASELSGRPSASPTTPPPPTAPSGEA